MSKKLANLYFNYIYIPLYDFTTVQLTPYKRLQTACLDKLRFNDNDIVLCVGVGTGSEVTAVINRNSTVEIKALDTSTTALHRAARRINSSTNNVTFLRMDAQELDFNDSVFDKVICIHVMGFLERDDRATGEIIRVLKKGGQFVITYPSGSGGRELGGEVLKGSWHKLKSGHLLKALGQVVSALAGGIIFAPGSLLVKPDRGFYSMRDLQTMWEETGIREYAIDEDRPYQDYIVYGKK
ncbi:MAG: class I SAM-dependent methyltransferase [Dehalococcoidia bacterium]